MSGHVRQRSPGTWEVRWQQDGGGSAPDVKGGKREAEAALRAKVVAVDRGEAVEPSKTTVGQLVEERIGLWQAAGKISAHSAEQYRDALAA